MLPGLRGIVKVKAPPVVNGSAVTNNGNATSQAANLPSGIVAGELLLLFCEVDSSATSINVPAGWTSLYNVTSGSNRQRAFYKTATGSEGATVTITIGTASFFAAIALRIGGANLTPEAGTAAAATSTSADPPSLSFAGGVDAYLVIAVSGAKMSTGSAPAAYPPGYSANQLSAPANFNSLALATKNAAAANEDPGAFTWGSSVNNIANTVAIRAAA